MYLFAEKTDRKRKLIKQLNQNNQVPNLIGYLPERTTQDHTHIRGGRILSSPDLTNSPGTSVPRAVIIEIVLDPTLSRCFEAIYKEKRMK